MKFAFSTVACPNWDFETIVSKAREYGYAGVEIRGFLNESILSAANVFLTDPGKVRRIFAGHGVEIACLASSIAFKSNKRADAQSAVDLKRYIDVAAEIGSPLVKIFDTQVKAGQDRSSVAVKMGQWLLPIGDYAAEKGVSLVIENMLSFRQSKEMWSMLETISQPAIGVCWDIFNAALVGESPLISVPTLNNRISYVHVKDAHLGSLGATLCPLGEGDVQVERFLKRLMGIGYAGYTTFEWDRAWLPNIAPPEEALPAALKKLKEWTEPPAEEAKADEPAAVAAH